MVIQVLRPFDLSASFSFLWCPLVLMNTNVIEPPQPPPPPPPVPLHLSVGLSAVWPAVTLTWEPYARAFAAILNNLAAEAEIFPLNGSGVKNQRQKKGREREKWKTRSPGTLFKMLFSTLCFHKYGNHREKLFVIDTLGNIFFSFYLASQ